MIFDGFWRTFDPAKDYPLWVDLLPQYCAKDTIRILGPFWHANNRRDLEATRDQNGKWDFFITGENRDNPTDLAEKCIGYRLPKSEAEIRFPYWQWYLTWPDYETEPPYERFGTRLSIDKLMQPINENYSAVTHGDFAGTERKAVLLTSHFKRHRRMLWRLTEKTMGGEAFGRKIQPTDLPKRELLVRYLFNLCPENGAAEGYITEKIPESFLCGCVPITYCQPEDLARDFNPKAAINLHGLSRREAAKTLHQAANDWDQFNALRSEPLLLNCPDIDPLRAFLAN